MLTGTALDLTPFGPLLQGLGLVVLLLALGALYLAIRKPKTILAKVFWSAIVVGVFGYFPVKNYLEARKQRDRFEDAFARFQEYCKTAGPKVKRVIADVDGIVWLKWRFDTFDPDDQYGLNDPYGHDCIGAECFRRVLRATEGLENDPGRKQPHYKGYRFVETIDPKDGLAYRYTLALRPHDPQLSGPPEPELRRIRIEKATASYAVTWDDVSTREDRDHWIAGSSLKAIDLRTNEVLGERIGYMFDAGLGDKSGGRQPWSYARSNACPEFAPLGDGTARRMRTYRETPDFLYSVLRPSTGG